MICYQFSYLVPEKELAEIMSRKKIEYHSEKIKLDLDYKNLPKKRNRESDFHRALKKAMFDYLIKLGDTTPLLEYGYMDVYSQKLGINIECGNTPVSRIVENLWHREGIKEVWAVDTDYSNNGTFDLIKFKMLKTR